ncbi:MAG: rhomboid family intramembrane serine protease [Chloroflexota bacterium]
MIPVGDEGTPQQRGLPVVNLTIIAVNILFFLAQIMLGDSFTNGWSLVPREITTGQDLIGNFTVPGIDGVIQLTGAPLGIPYLTLLTSMFMHGGLLHIGSNMLFLFVFGDNVEDNMGPVKYLIFYLLCGFGASFLQIFLGGTDSVIPNLGASGAIAGVLASYLILFPQARIRALIPLGFFITVALVPAMLMIGIWILTQIASIFLQEQTAGGGVAFWAHIGGFITGIVLTFVFRGRDRSAPIFSR